MAKLQGLQLFDKFLQESEQALGNFWDRDGGGKSKWSPDQQQQLAFLAHSVQQLSAAIEALAHNNR